MATPEPVGDTAGIDVSIVEALRTGDISALGLAYDRYAPALNTYAHSTLRDPGRAADVTHDSFVIAAARIGQLRDPERLRPWLYAIVRSECLKVLRGATRETSFEDWHETATDFEPDASLQRREIQELVRAALGGLSPKDREIVELSLRHDLDNAEIAAVLGVRPSHVTALTSRSRKALEQSLGTLLIARTGGEGCEGLTALLQNWDGAYTPLWRKRIAKHVQSCPTCTDERKRRFHPAALLALFPLLALPLGLRARTISDAEPALVAYAQTADSGHDRSWSGSPTRIAGQAAWDYPAADRTVRRGWLWGGAACVAVVIAVAAIATTIVDRGEDPASTPSVVMDNGQIRLPESAPTVTPTGAADTTGPALTTAEVEGVVPQTPGVPSSEVVPGSPSVSGSAGIAVPSSSNPLPDPGGGTGGTGDDTGGIAPCPPLCVAQPPPPPPPDPPSVH
ncbi:RNA polymerase sigma factor [Williamsia soli]|uniref:RNA polymerase sigma factor n=1 Tax=Williamsia soli TaxID=364929 RepID=UPI001A9E8A02|nr:sigma-70 family RNA polymerase sigma factor [Williamsia soli]